MEKCSCVGHEFLRYAHEILAKNNPESALYLGCVAEYELFRLWDYEAGVKAIDFNVTVRNVIKNQLERSLKFNGIPRTKENLERQVEIFSRGIRDGLNRVIQEQGYANMCERPIPEDLIQRTKDVIMEMAE